MPVSFHAPYDIGVLRSTPTAPSPLSSRQKRLTLADVIGRRENACPNKFACIIFAGFFRFADVLGPDTVINAA